MGLQDRIGFGFFPVDARQAVDVVVRADAAGVDTAWSVMPAVGRDSLSLLAAAAVLTERIKLGTSIVPSYTRHPLGLVTQALTLHDLAPGRLRLGIGTGNLGLQATAYGLPVDRPLARLQEYVEIVRAALRDGRVSYAGQYYTVEAEFPSATGTPVPVSALGEKAFELAGEISDGAITWMCPAAYVDAVGIPSLEVGARRASRSAPLLIEHVLVAPTTDRDAARAAGRSALAYYATLDNYRRMFAAAGYPVDPDGGVPDTLVDALVVAGDDQEIAESLRRRLDERPGELLVNLAPGDDPRADEGALFRIIARL